MKTFIKSTAVVVLLGWATLGNVPHQVIHEKNWAVSASQFLNQMARFNQSYAGSWHGLTLNITNTLRNSIGMIMGYGSHQSYLDFVCSGNSASCSGPPENGIIGTITGFVNQLPSIGQSAGISSCEAVPSSGTLSGKDTSGNTVSLTFETPTHAIPTHWLQGGITFQHRVKFGMNITNIGPSAVPTTIAYEFNCGDSAASYAAVSMDVDTSAHPGYKRNIAIFNGPVDSSTNGLQVFMGEYDINTPAHIRGAHAVDIHFNSTTHLFNIWGVTEGNGSLTNNNGFNIMVKLNGNGNYSTGVARMYANVFSFNSANGDNDGKIDSSNIQALSGATDILFNDGAVHTMGADLNTDTGAGLAGVSNGAPHSRAYEACINFTSPDTANIPSHADCSAFSLSATTDTAPALDANGHWTVDWVISTMASHLESF